MPLNAQVFGLLIAKEFASKNFTGSKNVTLAQAIGSGVINYILGANFYKGQSTGIGTGVGAGTGTVKGVIGTTTGLLIYKAMLSKNLSLSKNLHTQNNYTLR